VTELVETDVEDLLTDLSTVESIIESIESTTETFVGGILGETITLVESELSAAVAAVQPFVTPLLTFVGAVTCPTCDSGLISQLETAAQTVAADAAALGGIVL